MKTKQTGNLKRPVHNFPENQILLFIWRIVNQEQAHTVVDHFATPMLCSRCHIVALAKAKFTTKGNLVQISYQVVMPNGTGNFWNFQISRKKDNLERLIEISNRMSGSFLFHSIFSRDFGQMGLNKYLPD